ncbi:Rne/Rng family ribonuclease [uncultured Algimonas sp.]|uniref:Rne/Rng family ribonuclease n=1 Tax=uncultured Algimonas sp. TaxID=1547920 RepID=UPI0026336FE1|nr:Rne/Rng family ribonuclease [uncultured Algimonas sp.]
MTKRMLIDAAHPEETRVVIVDGTRVEELDFESRNKRQLRGNVYLAKVTRVEPSLQAAFIEYGGNRHGFLAFSEIHPDYYQIPYEDKLALQQEVEAELAAEEDDENETVEEDENLDPDEDDTSDENDAEVADEQVKVASRRRRSKSKRRYKIQEVIKRGQILLVQAVKEERGNKGAAMTTYLSLAGRYCVLMPNTPRGGGISRKIANGSDRKRLKTIMSDLEVPQGMGVIVRTAGAKRTKAEITRDYSYLSRLWDEIRDTTLKSVAPALIHEEGNLVKRSIRDLYNKDIEEVLVQGEEAYKTAKAFIKMLMPSHAKFVKKYDDSIPLFLRYDVERQIENGLDATVKLKSGGYLVIHPTEALVSVDVNSGKSTKERNVERTALKTNLEAAEELARQMRLRDLAGLIVVDFIDMDERKNNSAVERKMKDSLSRDRARIQTSRISQFGLMEISRQRRRRSLLEGSTAVCKHCDGVGRKRTVESSALAAIRAVEEFAIRGRAKKIRLKCPPDVALYLLNEKRDLLTKVDENADVFTVVEHDDALIRPDFTIEVSEKRSDGRKDPLVQIEKDLREESKQAAKNRKRAMAVQDEDEDDTEVEATEDRTEDDDAKPRRRRGRRGGRNRKRQSADPSGSDAEAASEETGSASSDDETESAKPKRRRRRGPKKDAQERTEDSAVETDDRSDTQSGDRSDNQAGEDTPKPKRRRSSSRRKAPSRSGGNAEPVEDAAAVPSEDEAEAPKRRRRAPSRASDDTADDTADEAKPARRRRAPSKPKAEDTSEAEDASKPKRRRAAPKRDAGTSADTEDKPKRRRAPKKDDADAPEADAKPARRRRAPAKGAAKEASKAASGNDAPKAKPVRKRKAPSQAKAEDGQPAKPARKKAAPKKPATQKPVTEKAEASEDEAPAKPAARRKPAKAGDADEKPARRRRAPARKSAPAAKTESDTKAEPAPAAERPAEAEPAEARRRKAPPRRKRGLIDRLMGKD